MFDSNDLLIKAAELSEKKIPFVVVTVIRSELSTAAKSGSKAIVTESGIIYGWIGGGCAQPAVISSAKACLGSKKPRYIRVSPNNSLLDEANDVLHFTSHCESGGTLDLFLDPYLPKSVVTIYGCSPLTYSLDVYCRELGFDVQIAAPTADASYYSKDTQVYNAFEIDFPEDVIHAPLAVVSTQGQFDLVALEAALRSPAPYIAFVASEVKARKLRQQLMNKGWEPSSLARIHAPAGVDITAKTPAEVALSIAGGLINIRNTVHEEIPVSPDHKNIPTQSDVTGCCGSSVPVSKPSCCSNK